MLTALRSALLSRTPLASIIRPYSPSNANQYYAGSIGLRLLNRASILTGTSPSTKTRYANYIQRRSAPWTTPASTQLILALPNFYVIEQNANTNVAQIAQDVTITDCWIQYVDANSITRNVSCTFSNGGVLSASGGAGGILATTQSLPAAIPPWSPLKIGIGTTLPAGATLIAGPAALTGSSEAGRMHDTTSFTTQLSTGAALTGLAGSTSGSIGGFLYAPFAIFCMGADGRPILLNDGNSISYGKGMDSSISPDGIMGIIEAMCADTSNGTYRVPCINTGIASSAPQYTFSGDAAYNPNILDAVRNLIDQVTAVNSALGAAKPWPYTDYVCEHGTNSNGTPYQTLSTFRTMMQARWAWLTSWHPGKVIQTTMLQKATSTDMFQTTANQSVQNVDQAAGNRFNWNDALTAPTPPAGCDYAVNTYSVLGVDGGANRDKIAKAPNSWTTHSTDTGSGSTMALSGAVAPAIGMAIAINGTPTALTQFTITNTTSGTNTVTTSANFTTLGIVAGQTFTPATTIGGLTAGTTYTILSVTNSGANSTFTVSNTLSTASGSSLATLNAAARLISTVTGTGPWTVTTITGSSSGTFPNRATGALVCQIYTADGQPALSGLHWSAPAVALVAPLLATWKRACGSWTG